MTRTRYLTTEQAAGRLDGFAFVELASAHILAGWIVKTPDIDTKIAWGLQLAANMQTAAHLHDRAEALRAGSDSASCIPASWSAFARAIDESRETTGILRGLYGLKQNLAAHYAEYLLRADPVADAGSIELVQAGARMAQDQCKWYRKRVGTVRLPRVPALRGPRLTFEAALWRPLDRVPHVARPAWMKRGQPGALRVLPIRPRQDTGLFLHNFLNEELTTLELIARNSYEHPEMPWAFHRDAARQAGDEARHALLFLRALPDYGLRYGDHPIYTYSYEGEYEFEPCEPGSSRELLWRILLRQVVHEGMALDSTPFEVRKREYLHQPELARLFGYTLADEVFHAGAGLKWGRYLVQGDEAAFRRERDTAYAYYQDRLKDRRLTWGASHLEQAAAEADRLEELARHHRFPFEMQVNVAARQRAGYTTEDIQREQQDRDTSTFQHVPEED